MRRRLLLLVLLAAAAVIADETRVFPILASTVRLGKQPEGFYLVPTNQLLRPWGRLSLIAGRPVDMAFDSHHRTLAVLNWRSVLLVDGVSGVRLAEVESRATSYAGIAFRPGDREVWASEASGEDRDTMLVIELSDAGRARPFQPDRALPGHPVPVGIAFSADGSAAYVALSRDNALAVIDTASRRVVRRIDVGIAPFGVAAAKQRHGVRLQSRRPPAARQRNRRAFERLGGAYRSRHRIVGFGNG
jgi:YVTN family beta-propeller protein